MKKRFAAAAVAAFILVALLFAQGPVQKVRLWDTNLSHSLLLKWNEDRASAYTMNWIGITGDRTITLQGNPTLDDWFDQDYHIIATPTFAGLYLKSSTAAPFLKLTNESNTARDPIIQFAVGATPVTKFTMGVDDNDDNKWKLAVGDKFGEDYDTIVVSSGEGSAPPIAEFTLIDSLTTGTHTNPRGVCADANYVYYSFQDQLVKIDKTTGAELAISAAVPLNTYNMYSCVTDGTYVYVACRGTSRVRKYFCSDLTYDSTSEYWSAYLTGLAYWGGYLYITSYGEDNVRKIRCSDMVTQWTTAFTVGAGDNQLDDPYGIAADNQYVYVQDLDNDRIVRLNASDGSWVDATAVPQTFSSNSWAMWCAGDYLYNTALYAANDCKVEKRNKADLSISETFDMATDYAKQGWQRDDYHYVVDGIAEYVYKYQYVSFGGAGNSHIKFRLKDAYGQFIDIAILTDEVRLGVGTTIPSETIEAIGNIKATAGQFISTMATGTAPVVVSSTTVCTNLNAGLVDGYHHDQSLLIAASPTFVALNLSATSNQIVLQSAGVTGTITATPASSNKVWTLQDVTGTIYQTAGTDVAVADGGTGKSSFTQYAIPYASAATTIGEIAIGTAGQVLAVNGGANGYTWAAALSNPMTDIGDMIIGGAAGAPAKLADVAVGSYLASGGVGAAPAWAPLNQAAVADLTTADGPTFDHLHITNGIETEALTATKLAATGYVSLYTYSDTLNHYPIIGCYKSHSDIKELARTLDGEWLGMFRFYGTTAVPGLGYGAYIAAIQNGPTGTYIPADMRFVTHGAEAAHYALTLTTSGGVHVGGTSDVDDDCLLVDSDVATATVTATGDIKGGDAAVFKGKASFSILDDAAYSFTPSATIGIFCLSSALTGDSALVSYRCTATNNYTMSLAAGANVNVTTGALTGTTGTDGKITVSTHTDGKIYIENRRGATRYFGFMIIAGE